MSRSRYEFNEDTNDPETQKSPPRPPPGRNPLLEGVCRACVDINEVLTGKRRLRAQHRTDAAGKGEPARVKPECPLDQVSLGRKSWSVLHTIAAYYPDQPSAQQSADMDAFLRSFSRLFPCPHCSEEFQANIAESPPPVGDGRALNRWLCEQHNIVNERLGKPKFDCAQVLDRWRDGWPDGSCDY